MIIEGRCHTNLDDYRREDWVTEFIVRPQVGDYVQSKSGKVLKIVTITHCYDFKEEGLHGISIGKGPEEYCYLDIELHK